MDPQRLIEIALSYVGISGDVPAFHELLGPIKGGGRWPLDKIFISGKQGVSTCAIACRGWLRILGMLLGPYVTSSGLRDVIELAGDAWITDGSRPPPGSVAELQGPTSIHCVVIIKWVGNTATVVAGGMNDPRTGLQAIKCYEIVVTGGNWEGKSLVGWLDVSRLT